MYRTNRKVGGKVCVVVVVWCGGVVVSIFRKLEEDRDTYVKLPGTDDGQILRVRDASQAPV
jgi:hypothetical protein